MQRGNSILAILITVPLLVCCQTAPTYGLARFYLKTPSSLTPQTNFTVLYHLMRRSQNWPDPETEDLSEDKLLPILGNRISSYLSTKMPSDFGSVLRDNKVSEKELLKTMPQSLKTIKFDFSATQRKRYPRSKALTTLLQLLLWRRAHCPVEYRWMDLGIYVWPRYMKVGYCPRKSCSIPSGMSCQPSNKGEHVKLLLWFCSRSKYCTWKIYSESITTECQCQCKS